MPPLLHCDPPLLGEPFASLPLEMHRLIMQYFPATAEMLKITQLLHTGLPKTDDWELLRTAAGERRAEIHTALQKRATEVFRDRYGMETPSERTQFSPQELLTITDILADTPFIDRLTTPRNEEVASRIVTTLEGWRIQQVHEAIRQKQSALQAGIQMDTGAFKRTCRTLWLALTPTEEHREFEAEEQEEADFQALQRDVIGKVCNLIALMYPRMRRDYVIPIEGETTPAIFLTQVRIRRRLDTWATIQHSCQIPLIMRGLWAKLLPSPQESSAIEQVEQTRALSLMPLNTWGLNLLEGQIATIRVSIGEGLQTLVDRRCQSRLAFHLQIGTDVVSRIRMGWLCKNQTPQTLHLEEQWAPRNPREKTMFLAMQNGANLVEPRVRAFFLRFIVEFFKRSPWDRLLVSFCAPYEGADLIAYGFGATKPADVDHANRLLARLDHARAEGLGLPVAELEVPDGDLWLLGLEKVKTETGEIALQKPLGGPALVLTENDQVLAEYVDLNPLIPPEYVHFLVKALGSEL
jgi:hypothetical protein